MQIKHWKAKLVFYDQWNETTIATEKKLDVIPWFRQSMKSCLFSTNPGLNHLIQCPNVILVSMLDGLSQFNDYYHGIVSLFHHAKRQAANEEASLQATGVV